MEIVQISENIEDMSPYQIEVFSECVDALVNIIDSQGVGTISLYKSVQEKLCEVFPDQPDNALACVSETALWLVDLETKRSGMSPQHHGEINIPAETPYWIKKGISYEERIAQLRLEYAGDQVAQKQLDVYEGGNEYHRIHKLYVAALKEGDIESQEQFEFWFKENGYAESDLLSTGWDE